MRSSSDIDFTLYINEIKSHSLKQKLGELEIRLGQARLENDLIKIRELETERAAILSEINPVLNIEIPYPDPIAEAAYQGLAGEIVRNIAPQSEADPVALLMNLLTAFGNVIGDKVYYLVGTEKHHFRLLLVSWAIHQREERVHPGIQSRLYLRR